MTMKPSDIQPELDDLRRAFVDAVAAAFLIEIPHPEGHEVGIFEKASALLARIEKEKVRPQEGCKCQRCLEVYRVDMNIPDSLWKEISGGDTILCGPCIASAIETRAKVKQQFGYFNVAEREWDGN